MWPHYASKAEGEGPFMPDRGKSEEHLSVYHDADEKKSPQYTRPSEPGYEWEDQYKGEMASRGSGGHGLAAAGGGESRAMKYLRSRYGR